MKKLNLVLIVLCALLFNSCEKADKTVYTISGHFYHDCNMEPVKNYKVILFEDANNGGAIAGGELATTYTDSTGYFKFEFQDKKGINLIFRVAAGAGFNNLMEGIPVRTSIENLDVYYSPSTNIQVKLKVNNPHTANDTLHISAFNSTSPLGDTIVIGPLASGVLYTVTNKTLLFQSYSGSRMTISWWFNTYMGTYEEQDFIINKYCKDTIFVTATIN